MALLGSLFVRSLAFKSKFIIEISIKIIIYFSLLIKLIVDLSSDICCWLLTRDVLKCKII